MDSCMSEKVYINNNGSDVDDVDSGVGENTHACCICNNKQSNTVQIYMNEACFHEYCNKCYVGENLDYATCPKCAEDGETHDFLPGCCFPDCNERGVVRDALLCSDADNEHFDNDMEQNNTFCIEHLRVLKGCVTEFQRQILRDQEKKQRKPDKTSTTNAFRAAFMGIIPMLLPQPSKKRVSSKSPKIPDSKKRKT